YFVFPHMFFSLHPDYLMVHRLWPRSPSHTTIECDWYFDGGAMKQPDFDPSDAVDLWDLINRQDWSVCERTQKGTHRSEEHTSELQSPDHLVCRLLLDKKKI